MKTVDLLDFEKARRAKRKVWLKYVKRECEEQRNAFIEHVEASRSCERPFKPMSDAVGEYYVGAPATIDEPPGAVLMWGKKLKGKLKKSVRVSPRSIVWGVATVLGITAVKNPSVTRRGLFDPRKWIGMK